MDQSFVLPMPHAERRVELEDSDLRLSPKIPLFRAMVDELKEKRLSWESCLQKIPLTPALAPRLTTTKGHHNLLHLAVLDDREDLIEKLIFISPHLKFSQNAIGMTALELAEFLPRKAIRKKLGGVEEVPLSLEPYVTVPSSKDRETLSAYTFLSQPVFESTSFFEEVFECTERAKRQDLLPPEKIWMGVYFDEELRKKRHPQVEVRMAHPEVGLGVFAKQKIPSCAFVGEYTGLIERRDPKKIAKSHYFVRYPTFEKRKRFTINGETQGNFTRLINHSDTPNLALQSIYWRGMMRLIFVALCEIPEGMQLTFDYGKSFWKEAKKTPHSFA